MSGIIRVSGNRTTNAGPANGPTIITAPGGNLYLNSTITNVSNDLRVANDAKVANKLVVGDIGKVDTNIVLATIQTQNVNNPLGYIYDPNDIYGSKDQRIVGALYVPGGVGIEKDLNVGGYIYGRVSQATTSLQLIVTATNIDYTFYPTFVDKLGIGSYLYGDRTGEDGGFTYNPASGKVTTDRLKVAATDESTATDNGAAVISGGAGIEKNLNVGGDVSASNIYPNSTNEFQIGSDGERWAEAYLENIYSKFIGSTASSLTLAPGLNMTEVRGDIRVLGQNPIGTAPIVTNTLYVTMDGDDTNDGRAQDASRACRTIGGAMNSPYYQPGTQIVVSAGHYLEDNPLIMKPYTSVKGSDIRTTFIEPINKTQDLFHMNSGCYLNYMNFLNGRSGLLEGTYAPGYNRGAYCTAFPPQVGDNRIDVFQSPYVQNCTNQSGPWLKDGTMFLPSQTVQVPAAVGIGTWEANTSSVIIDVTTGTLALGQFVNSGQQNSGFFNARTLMLANKPFLQSQVVAFIEDTFNSDSFQISNVGKCQRDTALIVNAIAMDMLCESTSDSTFAGIQYWNQDTYTGQIGAEITATIAAVAHLQTLALNLISNYAPASTLFDNIVQILTYGPAGWTDQLAYGGLATDDPTINSHYDTLQANRSSLQADVVQYVQSTYPTLVFNTATCYRDVGYIIDSVCFDMLHGGNIQSIKSGVYYYNYNTDSVLVSNREIPATTAAYNFIKGIIPYIVTGQQILNPYQNSEVQDLSDPVGTSYEVNTLQDNIDVITRIIRNSPSIVEKKEPISLYQSESVAVKGAYDILIRNIAFIQAEVLAFLDATMNKFTYNRQLSYRDAAILVENISYDMAFGGNEKSVESGLAYWNGVVSVIPNAITQCISAVDYLKYLCQKVVKNEVCPILPVPSDIPNNSQIINTSLVGGDIAVSSLEKLFTITTDIMANGAESAPAVYNSTGPDAAFVSSEILMQANREFIQESVINYINYNLCYPPKTLPYNQIKCRRDAGVVVDSIAGDLLFPTAWHSQSTFAGLQYYTQDTYVGAIKSQLNPTIDAITYLRDLSIKVVQNITTVTDALVGVTRYTDGIQTTSSNYATSAEVATIRSEFNNILTILKGKTTGWTDLIIPNGNITNLDSVFNTVNLLQVNKDYMSAEIVASVNARNPGLNYSTATCYRDVGYIIDSVSFDLLYGGNRQSIQAGLSYYVGTTDGTVIPYESSATIDAFSFLGDLAYSLVTGATYIPKQKTVKPVLGLPIGDVTDGDALVNAINVITGIIDGGPGVVGPLKPITLTASANTSTYNAFNIVKANKDFIVAETIAYLDSTYNANSFNYNQELCYRDTGLIVDAVSQDILLGGNQKSIEAGLSYWNQGYNYVGDQLSTTTLAINYARDISLQIIANQPVTVQTGTVAKQVINTFFKYGEDYMPQEAVRRNFDIITNIIVNGPSAAPVSYAGGGLFSLTGLNGSSVKIPPKVTSLEEISTGTYRVSLDMPTVGFGTNATLYFGDVHVFPLQGKQVEDLSEQYTGNRTTWNLRKVDPYGAMGGSLVDGAVVSERSPIQSFVYDAFTQLPQGGRGIHVTNNGYAQLVSVFTIFCSIAVQCDNGGIASITNSNCNFGDLSLVAKGYGPRSFSGTVFNPPYRSYPFSPNGPGLPYLDQFYPDGYWPTTGKVEVFVPDSGNRPHIGQVMEVIAPKGHINEQGLPGFLNRYPSTSTLTTGTITLENIDTTDVYIGNTVYIRGENGKEYDSQGIFYAATGTVVTDVNYNSITLSTALTSGGGDPANPNFFTLYFCGNSYYTVQTSIIANDPYAPGANKLAANNNPYYEGPINSQINAHVSALTHLNQVVIDVISNIGVTRSASNTATQTILNLVTGGIDAKPFIDLRFRYLIDIVNAVDINAAESVVPPNAIVTSGTVPQGAGSAITLITANIDFITAEIYAFVIDNYPGLLETAGYQYTKCQRDVELILQQLIYDLESGGNYNMVYSGLSYWSRSGTYHIVELGEAVRRPDLFPDGTTINFYQRSYISASGYLFEYVGAGSNYGALPQRGVADPVQSKETVQLNSGKVFFTSTDQNGDFRIGPGLVISQATGVLSGRTFVQSLYANMTPFILAIE